MSIQSGDANTGRIIGVGLRASTMYDRARAMERAKLKRAAAIAAARAALALAMAA